MPDDLRIIKTKKKLYYALGELMKENSFDKITVSDLIRKSGISRKTFYNHYQDKIDLVQEYQKELSDAIQQIFARHADQGNALIVKLAVFLNTQDDLLTALFSYSGSLEIQSIMRRTMEKYCKHQLEPIIHNPLQLEYQSIVTASSIFAIVQHWLVTGKKISPEELAAVVLKLHGVYEYPVGQAPQTDNA